MNKIINNDCIEGMKELNNNSIHFICTSPPYYNTKNYSNWNTYEDYLQFLKSTFVEIYRILKEGRMCAVNISPILIPRKTRRDESKRLNLPMHFCNIMEEIGYKFIEDIIWQKSEGCAKNRNGNFYKNRKPLTYKPNIITEYIFIFQKPTNKLIDDLIKQYNNESNIFENYERTNVWNIHPETKSNHPAPFPEKLTDNLIKYYTFINDIVLDPFMGSGTTAISCMKLNRNYIGFEIHEKYIEMFKNRNKGNLNQFF